METTGAGNEMEFWPQVTAELFWAVPHPDEGLIYQPFLTSLEFGFLLCCNKVLHQDRKLVTAQGRIQPNAGVQLAVGPGEVGGSQERKVVHTGQGDDVCKSLGHRRKQ